MLALIIFLGYKFKPTEKSFNFTVNIFSATDTSEVIKTGYTELFLGNAHQTKNISEGQSVFSELPSDYKGKTITLITHAEGYTTKRETVIVPLNDAATNIYLQKIPDSVVIAGLVKDKKGAPVQIAELVFADGKFKQLLMNMETFGLVSPIKMAKK